MDRQQTERIPRKCFICVSVDHLISKCPQPPEDNKERQKKVRFNERGNYTPKKEYENGDNDNDQKIYAYMERMYGNEKIPSRDFGDSSQLTNWILYSGATCNMSVCM